jgi:hypothetical protein
MPTKTVVKLELTPDHLMVSPCDAVSARGADGVVTTESLSEGYVKNTKCLRTHQKLLKMQQDYKKRIEDIYGE